ncbi:lytic transglycosylase domain-containing protein [Altererythrobacter sp. Root672]|uniref:lytic transglycosylase domain-containing protein n=1 Tax=Altererythrobacter sp. Root672 TaxID=1736584 RepID=UPI0009E6AEBA|nr:lytic transglycosylase domain-containing protein [Altererythrobacter sp. Root672]
MAIPATAAADPVDRWTTHVAEASKRFGVPAEWIRRVMRAESGGRTTLADAPIVSRAGAMGLMQLMPGTWRDMRVRFALGRDPHDPRDNILAGTAYLRLMYDRFGYPGLFAAYNAGPVRYARHLATGSPLPAETVAYLAAVTGGPVTSAALRPRPLAPAAAPLFAVPVRAGMPAAVPGEGTPDLLPGGLFALERQGATR